VFTHDKNDLNTFCMITSQFYINGSATQSYRDMFSVSPLMNAYYDCKQNYVCYIYVINNKHKKL